MRSNAATTRRMRLVIVLAVAAAATAMLGALMVAASVVMRHVARHPPVPPDRLARIGLYAVVAGVASGLVVLMLFAIGRLAAGRRGSAGGSRPGTTPAEHRRESGRPQSQAQHRHGRPAGPPVLGPTNVYTPGGLIGAPRDGHAPGTPDGQPVPEILRTAGPGPGAQGPGAPGPRAPGAPGPGVPGGRGQDRPPAGWAGPQPPRPGYQPGMNPGSPGRVPYGPGGAPVPPRDHMRPREAARPGPGMPRREGMPRPEPMPGAGMPPPGMPPRGAGPQKPQAPRPGSPGRPGSGHQPPRDPAYPPPPGQGHGAGYGPGPGQGPGSGSGQGPGPVPGFGPGQGGPGQGGPGRHAPGPGYAAPGGRRAAGPYHGPSEPAGEFEGGYAKVIRASDSPVHPARRPGSGRPADSARARDRAQDPASPARQPGEAPADVFVYRDTDGQPEDTRREPGPSDPSYWYDLPGTGPAQETPHASEEARGPFEPLVSSADPPGTVRGATTGSEAAGGGWAASPAGPDAEAGAPGPEDMAHAHARKLEQIKDLYLTAEAIGEMNVDKHFDQLLAQQRELISEYFRQSPVAPDGGAADQGQARPDDPGIPEPPAGGFPAAPENARVTADQPRAW